MITLLPNTASQSFYMTLKEKVKDLSSFTNYLIVFKNHVSKTEYKVVANVNTENDRYTLIDISTNADDAVNGDITITETGYFSYTVYGQNSTTNLDEEDATVVGIVEQGKLDVLTEESYYTDPTITLPEDTVYYE